MDRIAQVAAASPMRMAQAASYSSGTSHRSPPTMVTAVTPRHARAVGLNNGSANRGILRRPSLDISSQSLSSLESGVQRAGTWRSPRADDAGSGGGSSTATPVNLTVPDGVAQSMRVSTSMPGVLISGQSAAKLDAGGGSTPATTQPTHPMATVPPLMLNTRTARDARRHTEGLSSARRAALHRCGDPEPLGAFHEVKRRRRRPRRGKQVAPHIHRAYHGSRRVSPPRRANKHQRRRPDNNDASPRRRSTAKHEYGVPSEQEVANTTGAKIRVQPCAAPPSRRVPTQAAANLVAAVGEESLESSVGSEAAVVPHVLLGGGVFCLEKSRVAKQDPSVVGGLPTPSSKQEAQPRRPSPTCGLASTVHSPLALDRRRQVADAKRDDPPSDITAALRRPMSKRGRPTSGMAGFAQWRQAQGSTPAPMVGEVQAHMSDSASEVESQGELGEPQR